MTTITVDKDDDWDQHGWTSVPNAIIRDEVLTPDAKWAFAWLASHTKTYTFSAEDLAEAGPKGRNHARDSLRELEEHGWLTRRKVHDSQTGRVVGMAYKLHAVPVPPEQRTFVPSTAKKRKFPAQQKPSSEPAPAQTVAGDGGGDSNPENPRSSPATAQTGAGQPGAGQPGTGPSVALYEEEKTTREDQEESEPPLRSGSRTPAADPVEALFDPPAVDEGEEVATKAAIVKAERRSRRAARTPAALNAAAHSSTARKLVDAYGETCTVAPAGRVYTQFCVEVTRLLQANYPEAVIAQALIEAREKGYGPAGLSNFAHSVANRAPAGRTPARPAGADARLMQQIEDHERMFNPDGSFRTDPALPSREPTPAYALTSASPNGAHR